MRWYGYVSGDPLLSASYSLLPAYYDEWNGPSCFRGCTVCAILLAVAEPAPVTPPPLPPEVKAAIAIALVEGVGQYIYPSEYYRILLRC